MVNIPDDRALVELCRQQNRQAQKCLFDAHFDRIRTICLRYLQNEDDASDVLNQAFLKVFSGINQYKSEGSLDAWIKRIAINACIDFVRKNKTYKANFIHTNEFHLYGEPAEVDTTHEEFFDDTSTFSSEELFAMVADLPPATRVVFNLFVIDNITHKQISEKIKITEGTSKWHLSNARKLLKDKIYKAVVIKNKNLRHGEEKAGYR